MNSFSFFATHTQGDPRDWVGTTVPSPWTRSYSAGRYNLGFAASAALGLVSRSRASLSLRPRARDQPSCRLAAPPRSTTLVLWPVP